VAAKAGVIQLTKVIARVGAPYGINVNCIAPGLIMTDALHTIGRGGSSPADEEFEQFLEAKKDVSILRRFGKPGNIADLTFFLVSEHSDYITGQVICIDGGRTDRL
jgi:NAD(P)-dependent dehydrogenase (short-subunit alcohol dehydrogenase family)